MKSLKKVLSKRSFAIVLVTLLALTGLNTYLILESTRQSNSSGVVNYDYVLSQNGGGYKLKNMFTGYISDQSQSASTAINAAMAEGKSVYLNAGIYRLTDDVYVINKLNAKIVGDGATIEGNGHKIVVYGDNYTMSQYATISGLNLINGTIRIENSFATTITDSKFINATVGIEFVNTNTWSEYNKVENCQFINDTIGIAFRTPVNGTLSSIGSNATGSYSSSIIERSSFKLQDNQIGISIERLAEVSDSQIQNVRFWTGENGHGNQTGLRVDGSMYQTLLLGVVFESFANQPNSMYAIDLGKNCNPAPILDGGVSFLGNWTAKVHNPYAIWVSGVGSVFQRNGVLVPVGINGQYGGNISIEDKPLKITSFKPQLTVSGGFSHNETVTARIRIEYIDNSISNPVTHTFTSSGSAWLSDDEMMQLYSSQSIIWQILVDAKVNTSSSDASVSVSGYGTAG